MDALDRAAVSKEEEHHKRLLEIGNELLQQPPSFKEELLEKLDNLEHLLSTVKQTPPPSTQDSFQPALEALVADGLLRYPDIDVKVSAASCISEIMRITAPDQPYDDSKLKDFFELAVLAFGKLSCLGGHCYSKAVSIIEVFAKCRLGVLMWDLELDELIVQMFQHFLNNIRLDHPDQVFMEIEEIMSMIIKESEVVPMQLLDILISSVKKENQHVSPRSYVLGEKVLQDSAVNLHPYLPEAVRTLGISTNNYSEVVELICREAITSSVLRKSDQCGNGSSTSKVENAPKELAPHAAPDRVALFLDQSPNLLGKDDSKHKDDAMKQQKSANSRTTSRPENLGFINASKKVLDPETTQSLKRKAWKPSFLNTPEEGYDDAYISGERRSKVHILLKGRGKDTKKRSSHSLDDERTPIKISIKRPQKEKNDKISQKDGAEFLSVSARYSRGAVTKKKVSQPTSVAVEEFAVVKALEDKHEKDDKVTVPSRYRDKRRRSSVGESGAKALSSVSNTRESNFPEACKEQCKRKNSSSQEEGKATDDPTTPTMTMQRNLSPKKVNQNKGVKVDVHGYKVKVRSAPILAAIFAKYGDIAVNCQYKSPASIASLLDLVSDVVRRLKIGDVGSSSLEYMKSFVSAAADVKLDVTWLQQYLDEISAEEDMVKRSSNLMELSKTTMLVYKAAKKDLGERNRKVLAAEGQLKKAKKRLQEAQSRAGEVEKSAKVFEILDEKVRQDIEEAKDQAQYRLSRLNELL